jgi:dihydroorotase-like cyclic amidohydrolase
VKIITQNGHVTLRGPVRTEAEKEAVQGKAAAVAGATNVTSTLSVAPAKSTAQLSSSVRRRANAIRIYNTAAEARATFSECF